MALRCDAALDSIEERIQQLGGDNAQRVIRNHKDADMLRVEQLEAIVNMLYTIPEPVLRGRKSKVS